MHLCLRGFGKFHKEKQAGLFGCVLTGSLLTCQDNFSLSMFNTIFPSPSSLFQALMFLRLQGNQLLSLPPQEKWTCRQLKTLDLSRNQLGK